MSPELDSHLRITIFALSEVPKILLEKQLIRCVVKCYKSGCCDAIKMTLLPVPSFLGGNSPPSRITAKGNTFDLNVCRGAIGFGVQIPRTSTDEASSGSHYEGSTVKAENSCFLPGDVHLVILCSPSIQELPELESLPLHVKVNAERGAHGFRRGRRPGSAAGRSSLALGGLASAVSIACEGDLQPHSVRLF